MKTFRFKLLISNVILLIVFLILIFPFVTNSVKTIAIRALSDRADNIIQIITNSPDETSLLHSAQDQMGFAAFHLAIYDAKGKLLIDSQKKRSQETSVFEKEKPLPLDVQLALTNGEGVQEEMNDLVSQRLMYISKRFEFKNNTYVFRLAFPSSYIMLMKYRFDIAFFIFSTIVLILFSMTIVLLIYHFMLPIRTVIHAIKPYQEGKVSVLAEIATPNEFKDEFYDLAKTINSLSHRIKEQIASITEERNEKEAILESLGEGVLAVDRSLILCYANSMALELTGLANDAIGTSIQTTIHPQCLALLEKCIHTHLIYNDEIVLVRGTERLHLNAVATPRPEGAILILQDKSSHYKILEMRKEFIANASHELKTPITIIRGFAEMLHDNGDLPKETMQAITEKIVKNTQRMTKIIMNLLTLADIENLPAFRLEAKNLEDFIHHVMEHTTQIYPTVGYTLTCSSPAPIAEIDPELFEVAISNLLDNAAKYSKDDPRIEIDIAEQEANWSIRIKDHGIGIPEADLEHIFNRFYTVNKAESKKKGGSGLGLSIVETIINKHLGAISVTSQMGIGTTFTIAIPKNLKSKLEHDQRHHSHEK